MLVWAGGALLGWIAGGLLATDPLVVRYVSAAERFICPCHGGVGTVTECDVLVFAAVSNWGAYGIAAALAGHLGDREVLHDEATELRIVHASVAGGAMDGAYSRLIPYVDGTSDKLQAALITTLHQIIENGLKEYDRGF